MPTVNIFRPTNEQELAIFLKEKTAKSEMVIPVGGDTASHCGRMSLDSKLKAEYEQATRVDLSKMNSPFDYSPRDLVITLGAQSTFADLQMLLAKEQQTIPINVTYPGQAQVGGIIAANEYGSLAISSGTWKDYVLGITAVTAAGKIIKVGGQVVKNVAGYDVNKLLIGSLGQLAIITRVSLKVIPLAEYEKSFVITCESILEETVKVQLWKSLLQTKTSPLELNLSCTKELNDCACMTIKYSGNEKDVAWKKKSLVDEQSAFDLEIFDNYDIPYDLKMDECCLSHEAREIASTLHIFCKPSELMNIMLKLKKLFDKQTDWSCYAIGIGRISVCIPSSMNIDWKNLSFLIAIHQGIIMSHELCSAHAVVLDDPSFFYIHPSAKTISQRIKNTFDPANILNRGRYYSW